MKASTNRRALDGKSPGRRARDGTPRFDNHRLSRRWSPRTCYLCQPRDGAHGRPSSVPPNSRRGWEGQRRVTPRQTCPRPNGFGRNLRSKTRWFTGFCNSHQVSHFATFFIDARAEISVAESHIVSLASADGRPPRQICVPWRHPAPCSGARPGPGPAGPRRMAPPRRLYITRSPVVFSEGDDNDPSAGSPTETLLRLLLPLNDKVQWTSRDVASGEPPTSPRSEHFTGPFNR